MNEIIKPQDGALTPWEQAAAENTGNYIQGDSIKFRDGRFYIGKDGRPAPDNMRLAVTDLKGDAVQRHNAASVGLAEIPRRDGATGSPILGGLGNGVR